MPILVMLGLLMGGSASFAAENAVPGDVLFPVKVHVNENVRGAVAVTPKAKAEWEVRLVERRLEEVEKLAVDPTAPAAAQQTAQENLVDYTQDVEDRIAKFEEDEDSEDALETASNLSEVFNNHEDILASLNTGSTAVAGATATSTPASTATTTADASVANSQTGASVASHTSVKDALEKIREARGEAEKKHKKLKQKYHKEDIEMEEGDDKDDDNGIPSNWAPQPASTATSTVANTSATTPVIIPSTIRIGDHEDAVKSREGNKREKKRNSDEEIRSAPVSPVATSTSTTTSTTSTSETTKTETHTETQKANDND